MDGTRFLLIRRTIWAVFLVLGTALVSADSFYKFERNTLEVGGNFDFNSDDPKTQRESKKLLDFVADFLTKNKSITLLRIEVHTDASGNLARSEKISQRKALFVALRLIERGIECRRLIPVGFRPGKAVAVNDPPESRAENNRTVFAIAMINDRAVNSMPVDGGGKVAPSPCQ